MRIVYISQHFPPEIGAAQGRAYDMAKNLKDIGHEVTMLTTFPNDRLIWKWYEREEIEEIDVRRSFRIRDTKSSAVRRLANYLSFMTSTIITGLFIKKPDIYYATSPHLFGAVAGYVLSRIRRTPFVLEVRDLWVDFAELLGQFKQPHLLKLARKLENFLYEKSDRIVTVTNGYKDRLVELGVPEEKIHVVTNGVDPATLPTEKGKLNIRKELGLEDQFIILFAGNIGAAQGLDVVIPAAKTFKQEGVPITFLFIGEGVEKQRLKQEANEMDLHNVVVLESMKKHELVDYYEAADMCLVSLKKHPLFNITIPSKIFDCMAMNKPIIIGVDGEAREIVEENDAGIFFEPEDPADFVEKIKNIYRQRERLEEMQSHIRQAVLKKYNRQYLAKELSDILKGCTKYRVTIEKGND
ncbi:MAG: glycosyltransferase family 4 protein [Bacillaceae bacterium]|nr:glycosyltransferase family 4 protein [Bacillaceae bacterium]